MRFVAGSLLPSAVLMSVLAATGASAQAPSSATATAVPPMIRVAGSLRPATGPAAPVETVTFAIYADETGGEPLWQETQNLTVNRDGQYTALLGSTVPDGLPLEVFPSKAARWLGIKIERSGEQEQRRVLLASVPYALRASDADTLGGRPATAYLLAESPSGRRSPAGKALDTTGAPLFATTNWIPMALDNVGGLGNSTMFQNGSFLGVGTTTPFDNMHVRFTNTAGQFTGYAVQNLGATAASYSGMLFYDQNGALGQFQGFNNVTHEYRINNIARNGASAFDGSINFMLGGASKFIVASSGNVGIGTTTPSFKLEVLDPSNTGLRVQTDTAGGTVASFGGVGSFEIDAPFNQAGRLRVTESGRVSIGAPFADPLFQLHVTDQSNTGLRVETNTTGGTVASFGGNGDFQIDAPGFAGRRFLVKEDGSTGIGTETPGSRLDVNGILTVRTLGAAGATSLCRNASNQISTCSSSLRYKTNITPFHSGLNLIDRLRPIAFDWKANGEADLGLAAEEVAEVEPLLVIHNESGEIEGVKYDRINLLLINAIKEQQAQIARQQEEIDTLRRRQDDLVALKALICVDRPTAAVCKSN